ncbi:hypothetical protein SKAU_G00123110 [Synaphobranchus kaupii]|uniref:Uncharacterized protein n=1 Tax=Synaphobranchus kaupii TaxID=118154 RepID=A0A9Q1FPK7_SYNKA|nr:hypothetical protein SKAU_G00123110 [Synaphobranchus kaupii]
MTQDSTCRRLTDRAHDFPYPSIYPCTLWSGVELGPVGGGKPTGILCGEPSAPLRRCHAAQNDSVSEEAITGDGEREKPNTENAEEPENVQESNEGPPQPSASSSSSSSSSAGGPAGRRNPPGGKSSLILG